MKNKLKRYLALFLALTMCFSLFPASALAEEVLADVVTEETSYTMAEDVPAEIIEDDLFEKPSDSENIEYTPASEELLSEIQDEKSENAEVQLVRVKFICEPENLTLSV